MHSPKCVPFPLARSLLTATLSLQWSLRFLGPLVFSFTSNNPTGHHSLDLAKSAERDVSICATRSVKQGVTSSAHSSHCINLHVVFQLSKSSSLPPKVYPILTRVDLTLHALPGLASSHTRPPMPPCAPSSLLTVSPCTPLPLSLPPNTAVPLPPSLPPSHFHTLSPLLCPFSPVPLVPIPTAKTQNSRSDHPPRTGGEGRFRAPAVCRTLSGVLDFAIERVILHLKVAQPDAGDNRFLGALTGRRPPGGMAHRRGQARGCSRRQGRCRQRTGRRPGQRGRNRQGGGGGAAHRGATLAGGQAQREEP